MSMQVGGQAVIEGVMMRNKNKFAVAVRAPDNEIKVKKEKSSKYPKYFNLIFVRGVIGLFYTLYDGIRALVWSSNQQLEEEEKISTKEMVFTIAFSLLITILFFVILPFFTARWIHSEGFIFDLLDGVFRLILFLGYLIAISYMNDVKILFKYHGAEHKTINCYEAKENLTVDNVKKFSRFNPRCGTSFLLLVMIIAIIMFTIVSGPWYVELGARILLIPVVAGIAYELIKLSAKYCNNILVRILVAPGLWLQRITTKEPTDKQLEVAIRALKEVVE
jgi:uncharacterized protein YqhQ